MTSIYLALRRFVRDDRGQGMVEYGLIIALVALGAVLALTNLGSALGTLFTSIIGKLGVGS